MFDAVLERFWDPKGTPKVPQIDSENKILAGVDLGPILEDLWNIVWIISWDLGSTILDTNSGAKTEKTKTNTETRSSE